MGRVSASPYYLRKKNLTHTPPRAYAFNCGCQPILFTQEEPNQRTTTSLQCPHLIDVRNTLPTHYHEPTISTVGVNSSYLRKKYLTHAPTRANDLDYQPPHLKSVMCHFCHWRQSNSILTRFIQFQPALMAKKIDSAYLRACVPTCQCLCLSICHSVCLLFCLSVCVCVCVCVCVLIRVYDFWRIWNF